MALDFPSSPTNNQVYENYIYSATSGAWQKLPGNTFATTAISDTPPVNPANGDLWWNSADGKFYIYYSDGSSAQWVSAALPAVAVSDTPPAGYDGQMWLDSTDGSMYVYYTDPGGASSSWIGAVSRSGGILQVVSAAKTNVFSTTSPSFEPIPGLSVSITPRSTSSKILVLSQVVMGGNDNGTHGILKMTRDGSDIYIGDAGPSSQQQAVTGGYINTTLRAISISHSITYLDSPSTTSSTTYQLELNRGINAGQTAYINRSSADLDANAVRGASSITVMEVAG